MEACEVTDCSLPSSSPRGSTSGAPVQLSLRPEKRAGQMGACEIGVNKTAACEGLIGVTRRPRVWVATETSKTQPGADFHPWWCSLLGLSWLWEGKAGA